MTLKVGGKYRAMYGTEPSSLGIVKIDRYGENGCTVHFCQVGRLLPRLLWFLYPVRGHREAGTFVGLIEEAREFDATRAAVRSVPEVEVE